MGRRPLLLIGFAALAIRGLLFATVSDPYLLVAVQVFDGITAAVFSVMIPLIVADVAFGSGHFNLAQGIVGTATGIGASLSTVLAGYVSDKFGSSVAFRACGRRGAGPRHDLAGDAGNAAELDKAGFSDRICLISSGARLVTQQPPARQPRLRRRRSIRNGRTIGRAPRCPRGRQGNSRQDRSRWRRRDFRWLPVRQSRSRGLRKERADADQNHAGQHFGKMRRTASAAGRCRSRQRTPDRRPRSKPRDGLAGEKRRHDGGQENEVDKSQIHSSQESGGRTSTKFTKVNVPMKANRIQNPMPKAARSAGLRQCATVAATGTAIGASNASGAPAGW
jgi:hypothetical protein